MRDQFIYTFYHPSMVPAKTIRSKSRSPYKPSLLLKFLEKNNLSRYFALQSDFKGFGREEFYLAHTKKYVEGFFAGNKKACSGNQLDWSPELAESVRYTNASLYEAIRFSVLHPEKISLSPTGGFHHAQPDRGLGYCTFAGQVIASVKLYREFRLRGAYIDLDGHMGNSIEDCRSFVPDLKHAIPAGVGNINPEGKHKAFVSDLRRQLGLLRDAILDKQIHYVVFCHGADSHEHDDTKGQCTTEEWLECSNIFYEFVRTIDKKRGTALPLSLSLFGGYRKDDYNSVLSLHTADLVTCLNVLTNQNILFHPTIKHKKQYGI